MIAQLIRLDIDPALLDAALALLRPNAELSRAEPGCLRFDLGVAAEEPGVVLLWEVFADQAALDWHYASAHFQAWKAWMTAQDPARVRRTRTAFDPVGRSFCFSD